MDHESLLSPGLPPKPHFNKKRIEQPKRTLPISRRDSHSTASPLEGETQQTQVKNFILTACSPTEETKKVHS